MSPWSRIQYARCLIVAVGLLLTACQSATPVAQVAPTVAPAASIQATATTAPSATNTPAPATPTAVATNTATPKPTTTSTASPTVAPTHTPLPSPTATATSKPTARPQPTQVPATVAPTAQPVSASIYSSTDGPAGYMTAIKCERSGGACTPLMSAGDISFQMLLSSDASTPWTHFVNYGLSVEKDGANVANMFIFVDAGWLQPGRLVWFGGSRNFAQPGTYVIRSSGCMTTDQNSNNCAWTTMSGDVVTFVIQ